MLEPSTGKWKELDAEPANTQGIHGYASKISFGLNSRGDGSVIQLDSEGLVSQRVAVQFEKNGSPANPDTPHPAEETSDSRFGFSFWVRPGKAQWCNTLEGIVVINRALDGHWFIPKSEYEPRLQKLKGGLK